MKKQLMIKLLCNADVGCIVACNMLDALREDIVNIEMVRSFLQCCVDQFDPKKHLTANSVISLFSKTARGNSNGECFLLTCKLRTRLMQPDTEFGTVMTYNNLAGVLIDDKDRVKRFGHWPPPGSDRSHPAWDTLLARHEKGKCRLTNGRWLGREKGSLFWILPFIEIKITADMRGYETFATRVRDRIGLIHYEEGTPIVVLYLLEETIRNRKHARPTFADAGGHRRFKTIPDLECNRQRRGWGCTADLGKFQMGLKCVDGVMERVVESIRGDELPELDYWIIGFVSNTRGVEEADDDKAFAKLLMNGRSQGDLEKELTIL